MASLLLKSKDKQNAIWPIRYYIIIIIISIIIFGSRN